MKTLRVERKVSCAVLLFSPLLLCLAGCGAKPPDAPPPPDVEFVVVEQKDVPVHVEWVGTLDGMVNATIRAQVSGYLIRQDYEEGRMVKKGDLLFEIDPRPFQAVLDQALAKLGKTELDVKRLAPLAREQAISQQELDDAIQANLANKAAAEAARLNLDFTRITSPIDGIAGIAKAQIGDLVGPGGEELTTVSTVDPIKVYFTASEQEYLHYRRQFSDESAETKEAREKTQELELVLADGSVFPHKGRAYLADRQVDVKTGSIRVAGLFPNPGGVLRPGQFARVRAVIEFRKGALLVPQRAVTELQGNYLIAVIGADSHVSIRPAKMGARVGSDWIVLEGLKPGERVVAEGTQKVRDGSVVNPVPFGSRAATPPAAK